MSIRKYRKAAAIPALAACLGASAAVAADAPPNVVVIVADDGGYADFGCYGSTDLRTPHIDAIARDGVRMTNAYVTAACCCPSRAALLTGRYQQRFGHEFNLVAAPPPTEGFTREQVGLDVDERTIGDAFAALGYRTMAIGKWHMGNQPQFMPWNRGFESTFALPDGGRSYWPIDQPSWEQQIHRDGEPVPESRITYLTDDLSDAAVQYIESHDGGEPFLMYLSYTAVHRPMQAKDEDMAPYSGITEERRRIYAGMMKAMDDGIGRVRAALEAGGLADDTLVIFINDNGGATNNGSDNGALRGAKGTKWEGGIRVAFIMTWPGRLPAGVTYDQPVSSLDILPTAVAATGRTWQSDKPLDGVNLLPYLTGEKAGPPHEALFWRRGVAAAVREGDWKLIRVESLPVMLFNLSDDPGETVNLAERHPERVEKMLGDLAAWEADLSPPRWEEGEQWVRWQIDHHRPDATFKE